VPGPRLNLPAFFESAKRGADPNAGEPKRRSRSIGTLNTRPSSSLLFRLPAYTTTRYNSVPLSDSGRPLSVLSDHDCCQRFCHHGGTMRYVIAVHTPRTSHGDNQHGLHAVY